MALRYTNYLMAFLFGLSAIAQINDPDPFFWSFIYTAACVISVLYALQKLHWMLAAILALVTGIWALTITPDLTLSGFQNILEEIGMSYIGVEAAREFSGLMIIALWSGVLAVSSGKRKKD
ncbi:transmembrane 220 family protein [Rhodohalobacter sp. 8-1]|uniref:transmembrane 220 family protein n=1 Tax=Rhodohalobacter sp. 8-1 TaxID=3131972 RepID=UPI0030ED60B0